MTKTQNYKDLNESGQSPFFCYEFDKAKYCETIFGVVECATREFINNK